jgi:periplasmic protein TonB
MARILMPDLELPWSSSIEDDKRYTRILWVFIALMLLISIAVTVIQLPEQARAEKEKLPPQLARVLLEKKELPPPKPVEPPKVEEKKPEPKPESKPEPVKKPIEKPKEPVKPPPKELLEKAREKAANSGVMQFKDDLAEMRDMLQTSAVETAATTVTNSTGEAAQLDRALITSGAKVASGGINSAALSRDTGGVALSGRETTQVKSGLAEGVKTANKATEGNSNGAGASARSEEEIRKVMEQHKGAIYSIYNRALRQNAALEGKMVVKIVIDPSGRILAASLVSSELDDKELEAKILQRIRLISFPSSSVARTTINQTFDFLPQ